MIQNAITVDRPEAKYGLGNSYFIIDCKHKGKEDSKVDKPGFQGNARYLDEAVNIMGPKRQTNGVKEISDTHLEDFLGKNGAALYICNCGQVIWFTKQYYDKLIHEFRIGAPDPRYS